MAAASAAAWVAADWQCINCGGGLEMVMVPRGTAVWAPYHGLEYQHMGGHPSNWKKRPNRGQPTPPVTESQAEAHMESQATPHGEFPKAKAKTKAKAKQAPKAKAKPKAQAKPKAKTKAKA